MTMHPAVSRLSAHVDAVPPFSLSEVIRAARRQAGLSQAELGELLGVRQSSVSQWERGSTMPSTIHLLTLAATLKYSLLDFTKAAARVE
ncbi:MAG TPA: helix-turn-helix transcriptional regulator [Actinomycetes bacterium]|jgi:transcriptional regulator with XRE-family HTH domain|nr:helix-turn-helix transcriptional regulator [Actinomycetes bacterium]